MRRRWEHEKRGAKSRRQPPPRHPRGRAEGAALHRSRTRAPERARASALRNARIPEQTATSRAGGEDRRPTLGDNHTRHKPGRPRPAATNRRQGRCRDKAHNPWVSAPSAWRARQEAHWGFRSRLTRQSKQGDSQRRSANTPAGQSEAHSARNITGQRIRAPFPKNPARGGRPSQPTRRPIRQRKTQHTMARLTSANARGAAVAGPDRPTDTNRPAPHAAIWPTEAGARVQEVAHRVVRRKDEGVAQDEREHTQRRVGQVAMHLRQPVKVWSAM